MALIGKTKTVDTILAKFRQTITDLRFVEETSAARAAEIEEEITNMESARDSAHAEALRASRVAEKLETLLSSD